MNLHEVQRWRAPLAVALLVHGVMAYNAVFHHPFVNYDAGGHLQNLEVYSQLRLPTPEDSHEFFSPPLPYLLPAMAKRAGLVETRGMRKLAQLLNLAYSAAAFLVLASICRRRWPRDPVALAWAFGLLGFVTVWPKSFAFIRGEPLLALTALLAAQQALALADEEQPRLIRGFALGLACVAMALSRQWGLFAIAAILSTLCVAALRRGRAGAPQHLCLALSAVVCAVGSGWFYLHLHSLEGTPAAFNRQPAEKFSLANQPASFYLGLGLPEVVTDPIRTSFTNQLLPTFYSEMWGDYQCYFLVYGKEKETGRYVQGHGLEIALEEDGWEQRIESNRFAIRGYLGRAQLLALVPTCVLLAGLFMGLRRSWSWLGLRHASEKLPLEVLATTIVCASFAGYLWFLIMYPMPEKGDTIKATYMLQAFPFLALLGAGWVARLRIRRPKVAVVLTALSMLVLLHNVGLLVTRYTRLM